MKRLYLCLSVLILLVSCHKDEDTLVTIIDTPDAPEVLIDTRLATIVDTTSPDASNSLQFFNGIDNSFAQTYFSITDGKMVSRDRELIELYASNHTFYNVIALIENDVNYAEWVIPSLNTMNGHSSSDMHIDLAEAGVLLIAANALTRPDGSEYSGSYTVEWSVFNPKSSASKFIPSYTALQNNGAIKQLLPDISLFISIKADDGSQLVLKPGTFIEQSPVKSPSWFFDADKAAWTNNNEAHKIEVSKSGYYMLAEAAPQVRVSGTLRINNQLTPHYPLTISYDGQMRQAYTTNGGQWAMLLPSNASCIATVILPCGTEQNIQFDVRDSSDPVALNISSAELTNTLLQGNVKGCSGEHIADPMLIVEGAAPQFFFPSESDFSIYYPSCNGALVDVQGVSQQSLEAGPSVSWKSSDTIRLQTVFACDAARDEYLFLTVDGDQKLYWDMNSAFTMQDRVLIENGSGDPDAEFQLFITGAMAGEYEDTKLNILFSDPQLGSRGFSLYCPTASSGCGFTQFTITHFPETAGQWIRGYFQGRFWIKTFHPLTAGYRDVSGEFQVYREF